MYFENTIIHIHTLFLEEKPAIKLLGDAKKTFFNPVKTKLEINKIFRKEFGF